MNNYELLLNDWHPSQQKTRSQAVARIAKCTASQHLWVT